MSGKQSKIMFLPYILWNPSEININGHVIWKRSDNFIMKIYRKFMCSIFWRKDLKMSEKFLKKEVDCSICDKLKRYEEK